MIITICPECLSSNTFRDEEFGSLICKCCSKNLQEYYFDGREPSDADEWLTFERKRLLAIRRSIDNEIKEIELFNKYFNIDVNTKIYKIPEKISNRIIEQEKVQYLRDTGKISYRDAALLNIAIERQKGNSIVSRIFGFSMGEIFYALNAIRKQISNDISADASRPNKFDLRNKTESNSGDKTPYVKIIILVFVIEALRRLYF